MSHWFRRALELRSVGDFLSLNDALLLGEEMANSRSREIADLIESQIGPYRDEQSCGMRHAMRLAKSTCGDESVGLMYPYPANKELTR